MTFPTVSGVTVPNLVFGTGASASDMTNNTNNINNALTNFSVVLLPAETILCNGKITVPYGRELRGAAFNPIVTNGVSPYTTVLSFAAEVNICVEMGGLAPDATDNNTLKYFNIPTTLTNLHITRAATPVATAGYYGVYVNGGYNVRIENVMSSRQRIGFFFKNPNQNGAGISAKVYGMYTAAVSDTHLLVDTWPELYILGGRFGQNGNFDSACDSYIRITGGAGNGAQGPNSLTVDQVQFNQGQAVPAYWLHFKDLQNTGTNALEYKFSSCHIEGLSGASIKSTVSTAPANTASITYLTIDSCTFNQPLVPFFALDGNTTFNSCTIDSCDILSSGFQIAPNAGIQVNDLAVSNTRITGPTVVRLPSLATASFSDMSFGGDVTIGGVSGTSNNSFGVINFSNPTFTNGGFLFDANRDIKVFISNFGGEINHTTNHLNLAIGGSTTGITYSAKTASWQYDGNRVDVDFRIGITCKGTLSGPVTITNLPVPFDLKHGGQGAGGGLVTLLDNVTGITGNMILSPQLVGGAATAMGLAMSTSSGLTPVMGANLVPSVANPTRIYGHFSYTF